MLEYDSEIADTPIFDELWHELAEKATRKHDDYYVIGNVLYGLDQGYTEGALF